MIISNKRVNLAALLNFDLLQQLSGDLLDRIVLVETPETATIRCHLKHASVIPLFAHVRFTKVGADEFDLSNVDDPYPAVQLLVQEARCRLRFVDEHTVEFDGALAFKNRLPSTVVRALDKIVSDIGIRLKTFVESL